MPAFIKPLISSTAGDTVFVCYCRRKEENTEVRERGREEGEGREGGREGGKEAVVDRLRIES